MPPPPPRPPGPPPPLAPGFAAPQAPLQHPPSMTADCSTFSQDIQKGAILKKVDSSQIRDRSSPLGANAERPWKPFLIGVVGGTASGKISVCRKIMCKLGQNELEHQDRRVAIISSDNFYRVLNEEERARAFNAEFNFDHPDALDFDLMLETVNMLLQDKVARVPVYDFVTHSRHPDKYINIYPADVILFEGILVFYFAELRNMFQLKLFVDVDADTRLIRRMARDIKELGRDLQSIMHQYSYFVKPAFEEFCHPMKKHADVIIPGGAENEVTINLIVQHIKEHLLQAESKNRSKNINPCHSIEEESG